MQADLAETQTTGVSGVDLPPFADAITAYKSMVYSIAWHFLRDQSLAEELTQDVFLELYRHWKSLKSLQHLVFWLRKTTGHRCLDCVRRKSYHCEVSLEGLAEPSTLERVNDPLLSAYLERMVSSLPERQRLLIILRYQEGLEPEEIARITEMNVSTVKSNISRALELLRLKTATKLKENTDVSQ